MLLQTAKSKSLSRISSKVKDKGSSSRSIDFTKLVAICPHDQYKSFRRLVKKENLISNSSFKKITTDTEVESKVVAAKVDAHVVNSEVAASSNAKCQQVLKLNQYKSRRVSPPPISDIEKPPVPSSNKVVYNSSTTSSLSLNSSPPDSPALRPVLYQTPSIPDASSNKLIPTVAQLLARRSSTSRELRRMRNVKSSRRRPSSSSDEQQKSHASSRLKKLPETSKKLPETSKKPSKDSSVASEFVMTKYGPEPVAEKGLSEEKAKSSRPEAASTKYGPPLDKPIIVKPPSRSVTPRAAEKDIETLPIADSKKDRHRSRSASKERDFKYGPPLEDKKLKGQRGDYLSKKVENDSRDHLKSRSDKSLPKKRIKGGDDSTRWSKREDIQRVKSTKRDCHKELTRSSSRKEDKKSNRPNNTVKESRVESPRVKRKREDVADDSRIKSMAKENLKKDPVSKKPRVSGSSTDMKSCSTSSSVAKTKSKELSNASVSTLHKTSNGTSDKADKQPLTLKEKVANLVNSSKSLSFINNLAKDHEKDRGNAIIKKQPHHKTPAKSSERSDTVVNAVKKSASATTEVASTKGVVKTNLRHRDVVSTETPPKANVVKLTSRQTTPIISSKRIATLSGSAIRKTGSVKLTALGVNTLGAAPLVAERNGPRVPDFKADPIESSRRDESDIDRKGSNRVWCSRCRGNHLAAACPNANDGKVYCHHCKEYTDHSSTDHHWSTSKRTPTKKISKKLDACYLCNNTNHKTSECRRQKKRDVYCFRCKEVTNHEGEDHFDHEPSRTTSRNSRFKEEKNLDSTTHRSTSKRTPTKKISKKLDACYLCNNTNHRTSECRRQKKRDVYCFRCKEVTNHEGEDHFDNDPSSRTPSRRKKKKTPSCFLCNTSEHRSSNCPRRNKKDVFCFRCLVVTDHTGEDHFDTRNKLGPRPRSAKKRKPSRTSAEDLPPRSLQRTL